MDEELKKKLGEINAEVNKLGVDLQKRYDEQLAGKVTKGDFAEYERKLNQRFDELNTEVASIKAKAMQLQAVEAIKEKESSPEMKAYGHFLRKGDLTPDERKVLTISDDTLGGYLRAPADYVGEIIKGITELSPIRSVAWVRPTTRDTVTVPKRTGQFSASRVSEIGTRTERTGLTYGLEQMSLPEAYALVRISRQNLEDSAFNLEAEIAAEAVEQFSVLEGTEFISGNGVGQAEGFLSNSAVTAAAVETAGSNVIAADDLIGILYSLKEGYARNATWIFKRVTTATIRKLKGSDNNYLWQPGLQVTQPPTLLGRPIVECVDMPSGQLDNQYEVAVGDFKRGYLIGDRIEMEVQRLVEKYSEYGQIGFQFRKRFNAQVVLPEAIKLLKIKA